MICCDNDDVRMHGTIPDLSVDLACIVTAFYKMLKKQGGVFAISDELIKDYIRMSFEIGTDPEVINDDNEGRFFDFTQFNKIMDMIKEEDDERPEED